MAAWKLGAALACGNTVVLKPAEQTPLSALRLGELLEEAGFPPGVVNIVTGFGETAGAALAAHPDVDKVAFTGSTEVGKLIMRAAAGNLKRVSLELGGKSPNIVFADADLDAAAAGAAARSSSTTASAAAPARACSSSRRPTTRSCRRLIEYSEKIKLGPGMDPATEMGPLVSERAVRSASPATSRPARRRAPRSRPAAAGPAIARATSSQPTVFTDVKPDMKIVREEIFGPVVCADARSRTSRRSPPPATTPTYGLAAAVWTQDISKAHRMAATLKAGTVWINCYNVFDAASPFGGYKQSGFGREMGKEALELYTQIKTVTTKL